MERKEVYYPKEENMGKNCRFWKLNGRFKGCNFPNAKVEGRTACEGLIDDVCLYLIAGRKPESLTKEQLLELKLRAPNFGQKHDLPPGDFGSSSEPEPIKPDPLVVNK